MEKQESYIFWRLAHFFTSEHGYRIVQVMKDESEIWLEKMEHKQVQVVRLLCTNLDWSNWMQRDIEHTAGNGERIRKRLNKRQIRMLNIYVTAYPPVDDYQFRIEKPYIFDEKNKTAVMTYIADRASYRAIQEKISEIYSSDPKLDIPAELDEDDILFVKNETIRSAADKIKTEQNVFRAGKPFFTYLFVAINLLMFMLLEWKGGSEDTAVLIEFGAKLNPLILEGEWWRFLTPMILHIGFLHLLMNTLALFYLGTAVERIFGNWRFLFIYLTGGFAGTLASFIFSYGVSAGASGAIFGCFGSLLYFGFVYRALFFRTMGINILVVLAINIVFGFMFPGIDNAGHIGGLIGGFIATAIVHFPKKRKLVIQIPFLLAAIIAAASLIQFGYSDQQRWKDDKSALILSQVYVEDEKYDHTVRLLSGYAEQSDASAPLLFQLSYAEIMLGEIPDAKQHLHEAIKKNDKYDLAYYNLALLYLDEDNIEEAKKLLKLAIEIKPSEQQYKDLYQKIEAYEND